MILSIPFIICSSLKSSTSWGRFSSSVTWDMYCWRFLTMSSKPSSFLGQLYPFLQHDQAFSHPAVQPLDPTRSPEMAFCFVLSLPPSVTILICTIICRLFDKSGFPVFYLASLLQCSAIIFPDPVSSADVSLPWSPPFSQIKMLQCRVCFEQLNRILSRSLIVVSVACFLFYSKAQWNKDVCPFEISSQYFHLYWIKHHIPRCRSPTEI